MPRPEEVRASQGQPGLQATLDREQTNGSRGAPGGPGQSRCGLGGRTTKGKLDIWLPSPYYAQDWKLAA